MKWARWLLAVGAVFAAVVAWNYFGAHRPMAERLAQDVRNEKVTLWAYHQYGLVPGALVIDLKGFSDDAAMVDIMRTVLHAADAHKDKRFERVVLAYKGTSKFMLDGDYYQTLGRAYD